MREERTRILSVTATVTAVIVSLIVFAVGLAFASGFARDGDTVDLQVFSSQANSYQTSLECGLISVVTSRNPDAQYIIDMFDERLTAAQEVDDNASLRSVSVIWADGEIRDPTFLFTGQRANRPPLIHVGEDSKGDLSVVRNDKVSPDFAGLPLVLGDLAVGPAAVREAFEGAVAGGRIVSASLLRDGCELTWITAGLMQGASHQPARMVEGKVDNTTGLFELTRKYDLPPPFQR